MNRETHGGHAVAVGGGGLLAEHFGRVTVRDRNVFPETPERRSGEPYAVGAAPRGALATASPAALMKPSSVARVLAGALRRKAASPGAALSAEAVRGSRARRTWSLMLEKGA